MFTMESTSNLELMLRRWKKLPASYPQRGTYINAIKTELKLRGK